MKHEQQFAQEVVQYLDAGTQQITPDTALRLQQARQRALAQHQQQQVVAGQGALALLAHRILPYQRGLSIAALAGAVFLTFIVTQQLTGHGNAERGDAFLLASELPPEAYLDRGFYSWLEQR